MEVYCIILLLAYLLCANRVSSLGSSSQNTNDGEVVCDCSDFFKVSFKKSGVNESHPSQMLTRKAEINRNANKALTCTHLYCDQYVDREPLLFTTIENYAFEGFSNLKTLNFSGGALVNLYTHSFSGLENLTDLLLTDNRIVSLLPYPQDTIAPRENNIFHSLSSLTLLSLQSNSLLVFETTDVLYGLSNLEHLILSSTSALSKGENITASVFDLPKLVSLDLSSSNIRIAPSFANVSLPNLEILDLFNNDIYILPNTTLMDQHGTMESLKELRFNYNWLTAINNETFDNLPGLTALDLSDNLLEQIPDALNAVFDNRTIPLNFGYMNNPLTQSSSVPQSMLVYSEYISTQPITYDSNGNVSSIFITFPNCCSEGSLAFYNASSNTNSTYNEIQLEVSACIIPNTKQTQISFSQFSTNICVEAQKNCTSQSNHRFDTASGNCINQVKQCIDLNGQAAQLQNGTCYNTTLERITCQTIPHHDFNSSNLACLYNATEAAQYCAKKGQTLYTGDQTGTCITKGKNMGETVAIIVGTVGGLMLLTGIMVGFWYYKYYKKRIEKNEKDLLDGKTPLEFVNEIGGCGKVELVSDDQYEYLIRH
eukprot:Pgem_evm1s11929